MQKLIELDDSTWSSWFIGILNAIELFGLGLMAQSLDTKMELKGKRRRMTCGASSHYLEHLKDERLDRQVYSKVDLEDERRRMASGASSQSLVHLRYQRLNVRCTLRRPKTRWTCRRGKKNGTQKKLMEIGTSEGLEA